MSIYSALLLSTILITAAFGQTNTITKPQYVYVGNAGDTSISVFAVNSNGTLKPLEPRLLAPMCGMPTYLATAGKVLLAAGDYTGACNSGELGGALIYLYPIQASGKLGTVSQAYENDVEDATLDKAGRLAFTSAASFNPHAFQVDINGWNVSQGNLKTSLPGSPYSSFFNSQTGTGYLPYALRVAAGDHFLYGIFSRYSDFNGTGDGRLGVMSLLSDGGLGSFVANPIAGCKGTGVSGVSGPTLAVVALKSVTVAYQTCLKGSTNVIGSSTINPSSGTIVKTYNAFLPPSGTSLVPVAIDPSGKWLAASNGFGKIDILAINQTSGQLSEPAHHLFGVSANSVAFDHTGKFLYAAQTSKKAVAAYAFNPITGVLTLPALGTQGTGPSPSVVVVAQP
jgi:Lactonase, 7-bladed beta-propeller